MSSQPAVLYVATARGRFAALTAGSPDAPVVLCLHGFPDSPGTFGALMAALAAAGFRAVAPWLRGYAPSPLGGEFGAESLGADLLALCSALHADRVIGHDWGALAVYAALAQAPSALRCAVTMAVPLPAAMRQNFPLAPLQLWRSRYMLLFQLPFAAYLLGHHNFAYVDELWRRWSPNFTPPPAHLAEVKTTLLTSGVAPLNHYRAMLRHPGSGILRPLQSTTPLLYLAGANDGCIHAELGRGQAALLRGRYDERIYPGAGHFLHLERPREVAADIIAWLR